MWGREDPIFNSPLDLATYDLHSPSVSCLKGLKWGLGRCVRELPAVEWLFGAEWWSQAPIELSWIWLVMGVCLGFFVSWWWLSRALRAERAAVTAALQRVEDLSESLQATQERLEKSAQDLASALLGKAGVARGVQATVEVASRSSEAGDPRAVVEFESRRVQASGAEVQVASAQTELPPELVPTASARADLPPSPVAVSTRKTRVSAVVAASELPAFPGLLRRVKKDGGA